MKEAPKRLVSVTKVSRALSFHRLFMVYFRFLSFWLVVILVTRAPDRTHFGDVQLLLALVRGNRPENTPVDRHIALNDAHQLHKVVIGKGGNEDTLVRILCTRSIQQLTATFNYYHQHYGRELEQVSSLLGLFFVIEWDEDDS